MRNSDIVYTQKELISLLVPCIRKYPVNKAAFFGSYGRNEQTSLSDIDLLFDLGVNSTHTALYYIFDLLDDIESATGKKVDYVTTESLKNNPTKKLVSNIYKEGVWFYEV